MTFHIVGPAPRWLPPRARPGNECSGYLGYYTRSHLKTAFDLVDFDGCWPAVWCYRKAEKHLLRFFEEKLVGQDLHDSQRRSYGELVKLVKLGIKDGQLHRNSGFYVIRDADQLIVPVFPITIDRLDVTGCVEESRLFERAEFNEWLLRGDGTMNDSG